MPLASIVQTLRHAGRRLLPAGLRSSLRPVARRFGLAAPEGAWWEVGDPDRVGRYTARSRVCCNICGWAGGGFEGLRHVESATCPQCGSVARDRFLLWCAATRGGLRRGARVLETSPRMGGPYRELMRRSFQYRASDFDLSMHAADIHLDLQAIELPDASLDLVLTPHVLEHVPDTRRAIAELHRVVVPGGRVYLQVPLQQGVAAVPTEPEFHADKTPVHWRFGWDLTDLLRAAGFATTVLVPAGFSALVGGQAAPPPVGSDDFDVERILAAARPSDLTVVADDRQTVRHGWLPAHQFATWECVRR